MSQKVVDVQRARQAKRKNKPWTREAIMERAESELKEFRDIAKDEPVIWRLETCTSSFMAKIQTQMKKTSAHHPSVTPNHRLRA